MSMRDLFVCILLTLSAALIIADPRVAEALSPDDRYVLGPDSQGQPGVPEGKVTEYTLANSKIFPGFKHKWWLYIPAQYNGKEPIALMVFQDGSSYAARDGSWRVPIVLNNLIARKELPVMAAVFVDPGDHWPLARDGSNRSVEYDTLSVAYASFLLEEIFPEVRMHVRITNDPEGRGIAGHSSGGICAFTVAWQRPDQFRKVYSANGSFTNIRGGDIYPALVRQSAKKPIRIFLQSGEHDMVRPEWGIWSEANKAMAAAFNEKAYDYQFAFGQGTHSSAHAASIFPDAMRWLWRDYPR